MSVRLLVVGDALLDRDVVGRVERLCPDAPAPVVDVIDVRERPGGAGLAAALAADAGAHVVLATGLGAGRAGARLRELLAGVVEVHDLRPGTPTVCKTRVRADGHSLLRLDDEGAVLGECAAPGSSAPTDAEPVHAEPAVDAGLLGRLVGTCDAVLVSDYGGALTRDAAVRDVLTRHARRVPVVWDPHPRGLPPVVGAAIATPNRAEAERVGGGDADDLAATARRLRATWQLQAVCVTDGARGSVTALPDGRCAVTPVEPCPDGTDVCGAGDRFAAAVTIALGRGARTEEAVREAQRDVRQWLLAGGVGAVRLTATSLPPDGPPPDDVPVQPDSPVVPDEPRHDEEEERPETDVAASTSPDAVVSADELVEQVRRRGGTVVATGGCFDVLHAGHLALLQQARSLGDCLVVLLNSDASVRRLKGPARPVHAVADRARLLEGLACVDAVAVFEDDDPVATLARLRPDVWVKGGDYAEEDLPEARTVRALGGRLALVPYVDGHSTTRILQHVSSPTSIEGDRR